MNLAVALEWTARDVMWREPMQALWVIRFNWDVATLAIRTATVEAWEVMPQGLGMCRVSTTVPPGRQVKHVTKDLERVSRQRM